MKYYYNINTRPDFAKATITGERLVDKDSGLYNLKVKRAYWTREDALKAEISGVVCFWEGGQLYQGHKTARFDYKPLTQEGEVEYGINWATAFFLTEAAARAFEDGLNTRHDGAHYDPDSDTWSVHYHLFDKISDYLQK